MKDMYLKKLEFVDNYTHYLENNIRQAKSQKDRLGENKHGERGNFECPNPKEHDQFDPEPTFKREQFTLEEAEEIVDNGLEDYASKAFKRKFFYFVNFFQEQVNQKIKKNKSKPRRICSHVQKIWRRKKQQKQMIEIKNQFKIIMVELQELAKQEIKSSFKTVEAAENSFKENLAQEFSKYLLDLSCVKDWIKEIVSKFRVNS